MRVIAMTSGKGGVGKTHVAANLGVLSAEQGTRTLVIDADLSLANVDLLYGLQPKWHLGDVLAGRASLDDALLKGPRGVHLLPASSGVQNLARLNLTERGSLLGLMQQLASRFELAVVDTSSGIDDNVLFFAGIASERVLMVNGEPTTLSDAYTVAKALCDKAGVRELHVLVNPAATERAAAKVFGSLYELTSRFLPLRLRYAGYLPKDQNVQRATVLRRPLVELAPSSPFSRALKRLHQSLQAGVSTTLAREADPPEPRVAL